jgi:hypothetical protein
MGLLALFVTNVSASPIMDITGNTVFSDQLPNNGSVQQNISFDINFFGTSHSTLSVNENGNVTLGTDVSYAGFAGDLNETGHSIIAPFYEGVMTSMFGVDFGEISVGVSSNEYFSVHWKDVATLDGTNKTNNFQMVLVNQYDVSDLETSPGDFDIVFNYERVEWDQDLMNGEGARVGFSTFGGTDEEFYQMPGSANPGTFLDTGTYPLVDNSFNSNGVDGRYVIPFRNGRPTRVPTTVPTPSIILLFMVGLIGMLHRSSLTKGV